MARFKIETPLPANSSTALALRSARNSACDQINLHVVEQETRPVVPEITTTDADGKTTKSPSPNDSSVDRVLVTWWDLHELPSPSSAADSGAQ